ncbi:MAG: thioredoxin family protein [Victivallaceae bacterium]|nr:thioredoxin family protein [Victivallaceae bacterium]
MTILELTPETLPQHLNEKELLLDFYAPWCSACKVLDKVLASVAEKMPPALVVGKIDIEKFPLLAAEYGVTSLPRLFLYRDGALIEEKSGVISAQKLVDFVSR